MNNYNYHPIRWYTSTIATLTSFSLWFTWIKLQGGNFISVTDETKNGYNDWGFLTIAGIVGVFVAVFIGERIKPFDQNSKLIACVSFAAIALGGIMTMTTTGTNGNTGVVTKTGAGPWIAIVLGVIGLVLSTGLFKIPDNIGIGSTSQQPPPPNTPPPPPPPPSNG